MTIKEELLVLLETNRTAYLSGEFLAKNLGVTRAAVWKGISSLRADGFQIDAITNKGYTLGINNDILNSAGITRHLKNAAPFRIEVYDSVSSTNLLLRDRVDEPEGLVLAANMQRRGIGRSGRKFYSPHGTGIYFSLLLKPDMDSHETILITTMAAVAVCKAIERVLQIRVSIKWVNDIYRNDRKICGILTQGSFHLENNRSEFIILGIGLNVYLPVDGFPEELLGIAGALTQASAGNLKNRLVAEIINLFWEMYQQPHDPQISAEYKSYSFVIGREITISSSAGEIHATVLDIDQRCRLVVQQQDGTVAVLSNGEIQICDWKRIT